MTRLAGRLARGRCAPLVRPLLRRYYTAVLPPLVIRENTTDEKVFEQVFLWGNYDIPLDFTPQYIIDAGANVGYASLWFSACYPRAAITAVEPETSNYEVLEQNCAPCRNIRPVRGAVWYRNCAMTIENERAGKWAFRVRESGNGARDSIPGMSIGEIMERSGFDRIDILKLDIEGAEKELFTYGYASWLEKVRILVIELHDADKPGCSAAFYEAIAAYPFKKIPFGEGMVLVRELPPHE